MASYLLSLVTLTLILYVLIHLYMYMCMYNTLTLMNDTLS